MTVRPRFIAEALWWGPVVLWMALIFAASSLSSDAIESSGVGKASRSAPAVINQVAAHLIEFGVLAALLFRALALQSNLAVLWLWLVAVAATTAYGATDELHQAFVPGRYPSWLDVAYDAAGAVAGSSAALGWVWLRCRVRPHAR
jgi:VanZ family protein